MKITKELFLGPVLVSFPIILNLIVILFIKLNDKGYVFESIIEAILYFNIMNSALSIYYTANENSAKKKIIDVLATPLSLLIISCFMYVVFYIFSFLSAQAYFNIETILKFSPIIPYVLFSFAAVSIMYFTIKNNGMYEKDVQSAIAKVDKEKQKDLVKGKDITDDVGLKL